MTLASLRMSPPATGDHGEVEFHPDQVRENGGGAREAHSSSPTAQPAQHITATQTLIDMERPSSGKEGLWTM